jgi:hypothetical protein
MTLSCQDKILIQIDTGFLEFAVTAAMIQTTKYINKEINKYKEQGPSSKANSFSDSQKKKFPEFYGTRSFITVSTKARHLSLS